VLSTARQKEPLKRINMLTMKKIQRVLARAAELKAKGYGYYTRWSALR